MEAMAVGTPVVALRRGALSEIIEHGCTGFLVDRPEDLHTAISAAKHLSSLACRQRAETFFSVERMSREYLMLYREIASGRRAAMRRAVAEPEAA